MSSHRAMTALLVICAMPGATCSPVAVGVTSFPEADVTTDAGTLTTDEQVDSAGNDADHCDSCWFKLVRAAWRSDQGVQVTFTKPTCSLMFGMVKFESSVPAQLVFGAGPGGMIFPNGSTGFIEDEVSGIPFEILPLCVSSECGDATLTFELSGCKGLMTERFHVCCKQS